MIEDLIITTLEDLVRHPGHIAVTCPACGHGGAFSVADMQAHRRRMGLSTQWRAVAKSFCCSVCHTKPVKVSFVAAPIAAQIQIRPPSVNVPKGVDPRVFVKATPTQRERMIRNVRS